MCFRVQADPSAASQLIKFIQDERCRMDAQVLTGNLLSAFQIAQRLGNLQDVLHIRSCAQRVGHQDVPARNFSNRSLPSSPMYHLERST